jgi:AcrR family transcriptional regulator
MTFESEHKLAIKARKVRDRQQRQREILNAAGRVFIEKGFMKTTMYDIALEAGLSKPTVYQYFKTKDEIYMSLMIPVIENINNGLKLIYDRIAEKGYTNGSELINDMLNSFLKAFYEDPEIFVTFMVGQETGIVRVLDESARKKIIIKGRGGYDLGRMILLSAINQKLIKEVNIYSLADVIWGMFWGILQISLIKSQNSNIERTFKPTLELAKSAIINSLVIESKAKKGNQIKISGRHPAARKE